MIRIIDTYADITCLFDEGNFNIDTWKSYIKKIGSAELFLSDMRECLGDGKYTYEKDVLPILNDVYENPKLETLHASFNKVVNQLNQKVIDTFGKELDADIVVTSVPNPRTLEAEKLAEVFMGIDIFKSGKKSVEVHSEYKEAVRAAMDAAGDYDAVIWAGSLYLIGAVRAELRG